MDCPLTGKPCDKPKTIQITDSQKGETKQLQLCDQCGIDYSQKILHVNLAPVAPPNIAHIVNIIDRLVGLEEDVHEVKCPSCKSTYKTIMAQSRFGCDQCYTNFKSLAVEMFYKCQDGTKHTGKIPSAWTERYLDENKAEKIRRLKEKIAKAVAVENYEVAGELKRMITELEKGN